MAGHTPLGRAGVHIPRGALSESDCGPSSDSPEEAASAGDNPSSGHYGRKTSEVWRLRVPPSAFTCADDVWSAHWLSWLQVTYLTRYPTMTMTWSNFRS